MATMTRRAASNKVKPLAAKIAAAQGPEINTMTGWLKDWGKNAPSGSMSGMGGGGSMKSMPGMMSGNEMTRLRSAKGSTFDRMWLTKMIKHHTGAIAMAKTEQSKGENADAVALAKQIETDQTAEIAQMKTMLES